MKITMEYGDGNTSVAEGEDAPGIFDNLVSALRTAAAAEGLAGPIANALSAGTMDELTEKLVAGAIGQREEAELRIIALAHAVTLCTCGMADDNPVPMAAKLYEFLLDGTAAADPQA